MNARYTCKKCGNEFRADRWPSCFRCGTTVPEDERLSILSDPAGWEQFVDTPENLERDPVTRREFRESPRRYTQSVNSYQSEVPFKYALFDYRFDNFVSVRIAGVLYVVWVVLLILGGVVLEFIAIGSFFQSFNDYNLHGLQGVLVGIIFGTPIAVFLMIIFLRMMFESGVALVKIAQNTARK